MKLIHSTFLHDLSGAQKLDLPAGAKVLSIELHDAGFTAYFEHDDEVPVQPTTFYILAEGSTVPPKGRFITSVVDRIGLRFLYQIED